jgi:hypothetical protein
MGKIIILPPKVSTTFHFHPPTLTFNIYNVLIDYWLAVGGVLIFSNIFYYFIFLVGFFPGSRIFFCSYSGILTPFLRIKLVLFRVCGCPFNIRNLELACAILQIHSQIQRRLRFWKRSSAVNFLQLFLKLQG